MQTYQILATTACNLNVTDPAMNYLQVLMVRPFPPAKDGLETRERLEWLAEAEARYRVLLAQKILDIAQAEHN